MKILVLGSEYGDYFAHNVAYTLRKMGHDVFSDSQLGSAAGKSKLRRGVEYILTQSASYWAMRDDRRAIELVKQKKPDMVIVCTRTYQPNTINYLRKIGALVICWYGDPPANIERGHITSGEYDAVFIADRRFAEDLRNILGLNAFHLNEACNPDWHKPLGESIGSHILVAGSMYGYRNHIVERLVDNCWNIQIFGPSPPRWASITVAKSHTGIFLDHKNKANEFGRALACLNTFAPAERDSLNCRVFESCGCGGLLLSEYKTAMDECFDAGIEYLPFSTFDEMIEQLNRVKKDSAMVSRLRSNAVRRAHAEHTYQHRLNDIFSILDL